MKRLIVVIASVVAMVLGSCAVPARAQAVPVTTVASIGWSHPSAADRVIEVVDRIKPSAWKVGKAVEWLDKYTASDMRLVSRCSGRAYRCVTVREGRIGKWRSGPVGWSSGSTVTIDTDKAGNGSYRHWYKRDRNRTWLLVHELAHQHGLGHSSSRNVMNPYVNRYKMKFAKGQRAHLRKR